MAVPAVWVGWSADDSVISKGVYGAAQLVESEGWATQSRDGGEARVGVYWQESFEALKQLYLVTNRWPPLHPICVCL